jgi:hypothetical protein
MFIVPGSRLPVGLGGVVDDEESVRGGRRDIPGSPFSIPVGFGEAVEKAFPVPRSLLSLVERLARDVWQGGYSRGKTRQRAVADRSVGTPARNRNQTRRSRLEFERLPKTAGCVSIQVLADGFVIGRVWRLRRVLFRCGRRTVAQRRQPAAGCPQSERSEAPHAPVCHCAVQGRPAKHGRQTKSWGHPAPTQKNRSRHSFSQG